MISEVVHSIVANERSGDLIVESGPNLRKVMFDRGFIVFAASTLDELRFGNLLLTSGAITEPQLERALAFVKRDGCRIGEAMVTTGILTQETMETELTRQIRTIATSVYSLREGTWWFDEHPCRTPEELRVRVSIYHTQLEGVREIPNIDLIEESLGSLEDYVKTTETPPFRLEGVTLEPAEMRVRQAAARPISILELVKKIGNDRSAALRTIYGLLCSGLVELTEAPADDARPVEAPATLTSSGAISVSNEPAETGPLPDPESEKKEEISRLFNEIKIRNMVHDREGVASMLRQVVSLAPDNPKYVGMLAQALAALPRRAKEAEPIFRRAIALDPENAKLHYQCARYYQKMGMPSRCLAELKAALRIDPGFSEARRAVVELKQKDENVLTKSLKKLFR